MKKSFSIILSLLVATLFISSYLFAVTRGIRIVAKSGESLYLYKDYHALVVGVGDYTQGWPDLPGAIKDAREVASSLKELGFKVKLILDPTSSQLKSALNNMAFRLGREKNRALLLYYAGHGETLELADGTELGYIIPTDSPLKSHDPMGFNDKAVSMRDIEDLALKAKSKHFLMLFDSCFSGSLFSLVRAAPVDITEKSAHPVRQFITAGEAGEQVPDKSVFKIVFLDGIRGDADLNDDGYVTGSELGMHLQDKVVNYTRGGQHPQYGKINNPKLDKGDFVFRLGKAQVVSPPSTPSGLEAEKQRLAEEQTRIEQERQELERLKMEIERKKLEQERKRLEVEKKKLEMAKLPPEPKYFRTGKPWIGVVIQTVTDEIKEKLGLKTTEGTLIGEVTKGSPAEKGGLKRGDVIISFDGKKVKEMNSFPPMVTATSVGKKVEIIVIRKGKKKRIRVKMEELRQEIRGAATTTPEIEETFGLSVQELTVELAEALSLKGENGVVVSRVRNGSPASKAGLQRGDLIQEMEKEPVENMDDYKRIMGESASKNQILMFIRHKGHTRYVLVRKKKK